MKRYGIIGAGMMGREHINNFALVDDIELVALADPHLGSLEQSLAHARNLGMTPKIYNSNQEMLASETLDAVVISSPNHTHFAIMQEVMQHAVAILLEKPMCTTVKDSSELHFAAQNHAQMIWIGLEYRYMPPMTEFIERVHGGITGPIKMLSIREHRFPFSYQSR